MRSVAISPMPPDCSVRLRSLLDDYQWTYDCRYSTMHGMPVTGGRGFRGLQPLWYNGVPPYVGTRFLEGIGVILKSPTTGIETPKREKNGRQVLRSDEYTKMLSLAGAHPRDYAVLQVFLQTGIRVSELAHLRIEDIDFIKPAIPVRGKGSVEREIALEKKGIHALKSYLAVRGESF